MILWYTVCCHEGLCINCNQCTHRSSRCIKEQHPSIKMLTFWNRDRMVVILRTTYSNAFSCMKLCEFRINWYANIGSGNGLVPACRRTYLFPNGVIKPQWLNFSSYCNRVAKWRHPSPLHSCIPYMLENIQNTLPGNQRNLDISTWILIGMDWYSTLQWRQNERASVSNHQPHDCLLNCLFRRRSKKTSKLRVTGLCAGNSPVPVNSPHKRAITRKILPFDDVIMINTVWDGIRVCLKLWVNFQPSTTESGWLAVSLLCCLSIIIITYGIIDCGRAHSIVTFVMFGRIPLYSGNVSYTLTALFQQDMYLLNSSWGSEMCKNNDVQVTTPFIIGRHF